MVKDLNAIYTSHPALYKLDQDPDGFEWMSCLDADHSIVTFVRKTENPAESLFVVCNFTPVVYEKQSMGVPFPGKYKEIFNSDAVQYGGSGNTNPRLKQSKEERVDGRDNSIQITIPPLGCAIFTCTPILKEKN
jgi:1,4-alpha-glucan branching enzyme